MQRNKQNKALAKTSKLISGLCMACSIISSVSCKKFVDVKPPSTSINSGNVYGNDANAIAAVTNIYVTMSSTYLPGGGITSLSLFPALSSDELALYNGATNNAVNFFYKNALSANNLNNPDFWTSLYQTIYNVNAAIEGLTDTKTLTTHTRQQLLGESKFVRAFCYFYLMSLYGDVPLALGTDYTINSALSRSPISTIYEQIISDLNDAKSFLSPNFVDASLLSITPERVRPTIWAATALLARVYLYKGDWEKSEIEASAVINNSSLFNLVSLDSAFLKNNSEAIWQLQPVNAGWNTEDARTFILPSTGPSAYNYPFYLSSQLINSFELGDDRKKNWTKAVQFGGNIYYHPYKYKSDNYRDPITEYAMVLRLSEQYLIRSESRAQQNKLDGAKEDLNVVRERVGLLNTIFNDKASLLKAILHEKQVELFLEWGHRWFDLKRTGTVNDVMSVVTPQKGGTWNTNSQWYPISKYELLTNPNIKQNEGY